MITRRTAFLLFVIWFSSLTLFTTDNLLAQIPTGAIAGHITDASGAVLKGAQVSLASKNISVVSDAQGQFFITGLDPGNYTILITYVGFAPFEKVIEAGPSQTVSVNAELQVQS